MKKKIFYTELAYIIGLVSLTMGAALMEAADFGVSMVVAPAYLVYRKLSLTYEFFTYGMAEYMLQAVLLLVMILVLRKFKVSFLFSFVTAVLYGVLLDGTMALVALIPSELMVVRIVFYVLGLVCCAVGVSLMFHTYIAPEVYELFVKEITAKFHLNINKFKTIYDCVSCLIAVFMSFAFFGLWHFEGVKLGTMLCAVVNGWLIGRCSAFFEAHWEFKDGWKRRNEHKRQP